MSAEKGKLHKIATDLEAVDALAEEVVAEAEMLVLRYAQFYDYLAERENRPAS